MELKVNKKQKTSTKMIIDGHAHACGDYLTPEKIVTHLAQSKVDKLVLVPGELNSEKTYSFPNVAKLLPGLNITKFFNYLTKMVISLTNAQKDFIAGNAYVYELAKELPDKVIQFYLVTNVFDSITQELDDKHLKWKFKGLKFHQCWFPISIKSKIFIETATWAIGKDLPIFIHLFSDSEVNMLIEHKRNNPRSIIIVAHLFGLELFIKSKTKFENLHFDISTYQVTSDKRVLKAINYFGAEKILMGSDTPYGKDNLKKNIDRIRSLDISTKEKELILGENMRRLLKI